MSMSSFIKNILVSIRSIPLLIRRRQVTISSTHFIIHFIMICNRTIIPFTSFNFWNCHSEGRIVLETKCDKFHKIIRVVIFAFHSNVRTPELIKPIANNRRIKLVCTSCWIKWRMPRQDDKQNYCSWKCVNCLTRIIASWGCFRWHVIWGTHLVRFTNKFIRWPSKVCYFKIIVVV
jgi:hypothetical protein